MTRAARFYSQTSIGCHPAPHLLTPSYASSRVALLQQGLVLTSREVCQMRELLAGLLLRISSIFAHLSRVLHAGKQRLLRTQYSSTRHGSAGETLLNSDCTASLIRQRRSVRMHSAYTNEMSALLSTPAWSAESNGLLTSNLRHLHVADISQRLCEGRGGWG